MFHLPIQKSIALIGVSAAQGAAALGVAAYNPSVLGEIAGVLSVGSIFTAVGAVYVMREKTRRNETDIENYRKESAQSLSSVASVMREALHEHRVEMREDVRQLEEQMRKLADGLARIESVVRIVSLRQKPRRDEATD